MASPDTWRKADGYFHPSEFDYPHKLDEDTLLLLLTMRKNENITITINCDYRDGDSGYHGKDDICRALDIVMKRGGKPLPVLEQFTIACRYDWGGIGFYLDWNTKGIHVDTRPKENGRRSLWYRDGGYGSVEEFLGGLA